MRLFMPPATHTPRDRESIAYPIDTLTPACSAGDLHPAEVLLFARAMVELAWTLALERAFRALDARTFAGDARAARALRKQAGSDRMGLGDRLEIHAPVFFAYSFPEDFKEDWDRFINVLNLRNDVAHGYRRVTREEAWSALSLSRRVTDKILALSANLPPRPPPPVLKAG